MYVLVTMDGKMDGRNGDMRCLNSKFKIYNIDIYIISLYLEMFIYNIVNL